ncbi:MAG: hypothetical protein M3R72_07600 [Bacteroidota bacterium]|nr:hypothetical protein [Bacteroidota bacterium]
MKTLLTLSLFVLISLFFNSCLKDKKLEKYTYYVAEYALKSDVRANIKSGAAQNVLSPGKLYVHGSFIYLNEVNKGIHIIDYSTPSSPKNVAFIPIPGNLDLAVKGNYLYADEYTDLLTIDVTNPLTAKLIDVKQNAFYSFYGYGVDSNHIIASWRQVDTMVKSDLPFVYPPIYYYDVPNANSQTYASSSATKSTISTGGSTSRFTVLNNRLYTVDNSSIHIYNIQNASNPSFVQTTSTNWGGIETIYPFENNLFLGGSNGMYIFDVTDEDNPIAKGTFGHVRTCDPVIAEQNKAYVTLRNGTACGGFTNELDVLNIDDIGNPVLLKTYPFTNPRGLAKEGDLLFVCDGKAGLQILDAADANNIKPIQSVLGFEANDVILNNGLAIVVATDGLYFINYRNVSHARIVGKL